MKKKLLMKILSIISKKRKRGQTTIKKKKIQAPPETIRQYSNVMNTKPIPVVPDLNRELIREFGEYKKERFQQPDERNNAPSEINLYKEFMEYKTLSPTQFKEKISKKYNDLQKVERQREYNKVLLEEAKIKQKEADMLAREEETFNKKLIKIATPRKLKERKGIRTPITIEDKIIPLNIDTPKIIKAEETEPVIEVVETNMPNIGFELNDNDGLQSNVPEIASEQFIIQQPEEEIVREEPLIKKGRGGRPVRTRPRVQKTYNQVTIK